MVVYVDEVVDRILPNLEPKPANESEKDARRSAAGATAAGGEACLSVVGNIIAGWGML
jgi:hypothetical protein